MFSSIRNFEVHLIGDCNENGEGNHVMLDEVFIMQFWNSAIVSAFV